ncbi:MAG: hypothetical protein RLN70_03265, partial [Rhodospirillaceae bacterium]
MRGSARTQRVLLLAGGLLYSLAGFALALHAPTPPAALAIAALPAAIAIGLFALSYVPNAALRLEGIPCLAAFTLSSLTVAGLAGMAEDNAAR